MSVIHQLQMRERSDTNTLFPSPIFFNATEGRGTELMVLRFSETNVRPRRKIWAIMVITNRFFFYISEAIRYIVHSFQSYTVFQCQ